MVEADLKRRNQTGGLVDWKVADDADSPTGIAEPVLEPVLRQRLDITLSALRNAIAGSGAGAKTLADIVAALQAGIGLTQSSLDALENITVGGTVSLSPASLAALEEITAALAAGSVVSLSQGSLDALEQITATLAAGGVLTANQGTPGQQNWPVKDDYRDGEFPDDQVGAGGVLTFEFANVQDVIWVRSNGGDARAIEVPGITPTAARGWLCPDDEPVPLTCSSKKLKVFAPAGVSVNVKGYRHADFLPTDLEGCGLWLDADRVYGADASPVSLWEDASGAGRDFQQVGGFRPIVKRKIVNGHSVVRFDGVDDALYSLLPFSGDRGTIFVVAQLTTFASFPVLVWGTDTATADLHRIGGYVFNDGRFCVFQRANDIPDNIASDLVLALSTPYVLELHSSGSAYEVRRDGQLGVLAPFSGANTGDWFADTPAVDQLHLGAEYDAGGGGNFFAGDIAEIVVYDGIAHSATDRSRVRQYLAAKYGIAVAA